MRSVVSTIAVLFIMATTSGTAADGASGTAIGVLFGHPGNVGLSVRLSTLNLGVAISSGGYVRGTADLWMVHESVANKLNWFLGPGVDLGIGNPFLVAARLPIGLQWLPADHLEVFGQIAPGVQIINEVKFYWAGTVGVRYVL